MLHVITEIGKPGKYEREKRHYPEFDNRPSEPVYNPRGRRFIPHGAGDELDFTPHGAFIDPEYTECGPDWKSRLRWLPPPKNPKYITEIWPDQWKGMRTFPWMARRSSQEWGMYPEGPKGYDATLRCTFNGKHKATKQSQKEITDAMLLGKSRLVRHKRNGIPLAAPGDKSYQAVEYSPQFHRMGSTLPLVDFGGSSKKKPDTFIPLEQMPRMPRESFSQKERWRRRRDEVDQVKRLETWRPSTPLVAPPHPLWAAPALAEQETVSTIG